MIIRALLKGLMLPPALNLLLLGVAWYCWPRRPRLARTLAAVSLLSLYVLATPWMSLVLLDSLQNQYSAIEPGKQAAPDAIVILGGGRRSDAPEFGGDTVSAATLLRLRYGAFLHRQTDVPVLVSGGRVFGEAESEAELMARALAQDFAVAAQWREGRSRNTRENARYSAEMLLAEERSHIWLVTQAWHMPRSVAAFEAAGFTVSAAPTAFSRRSSSSSWLLNVMPSATDLQRSSTAMHEWLGIFYYRMMSTVRAEVL